jgi:hypothetical protein
VRPSAANRLGLVHVDCQFDLGPRAAVRVHIAVRGKSGNRDHLREAGRRDHVRRDAHLGTGGAEEEDVVLGVQALNRVAEVPHAGAEVPQREGVRPERHRDDPRTVRDRLADAVCGVDRRLVVDHDTVHRLHRDQVPAPGRPDRPATIERRAWFDDYSKQVSDKTGYRLERLPLSCCPPRNPSQLWIAGISFPDHDADHVVVARGHYVVFDPLGEFVGQLPWDRVIDGMLLAPIKRIVPNLSPAWGSAPTVVAA